jgi:hypothetical protein
LSYTRDFRGLSCPHLAFGLLLVSRCRRAIDLIDRRATSGQLFFIPRRRHATPTNSESFAGLRAAAIAAFSPDGLHDRQFAFRLFRCDCSSQFPFL